MVNLGSDIEILNLSGTPIVSVGFSDECISRCEIMVDDYILLVFEHDEYISIPVGSYIWGPDARMYVVLTEQLPSDNYKYSIKFEADYMGAKNGMFFYNGQIEWSLTADPATFMNLFVAALNTHFGINWYHAGVCTPTKAVTQTYSGTNIIDAMTNFAKETESEWWIDGYALNFSKRDFGPTVNLKVDEVISRIEFKDSSDAQSFNRLYAFGSTRNIPEGYRADDDTLFGGGYNKRLKLPVGTPYVDAVAGMQPSQIIAGVKVFDDVYPSMVCSIDKGPTTRGDHTDDNGLKYFLDDSSKPYYRFLIHMAGFAWHEKYLTSEPLSIVFQTGKLAGRTFEVIPSDSGAPVGEWITSQMDSFRLSAWASYCNHYGYLTSDTNRYNGWYLEYSGSLEQMYLEWANITTAGWALGITAQEMIDDALANPEVSTYAVALAKFAYFAGYTEASQAANSIYLELLESNRDSYVLDVINWFEIINDFNTIYIPNTVLRPEQGDTFVMINFNIDAVSDQFIPAAEDELLTKAQEYMQYVIRNKNCFVCPTNAPYCFDNNISLALGQSVKLYDERLEGGFRISRIYGYEKKLYDQSVGSYLVGDSTQYSRIKSLEDKVDNLNAVSWTGGQSTTPLLKSNDTSPATDTNVFSSLKSLKTFVKRTENGAVFERGSLTFDAFIDENGKLCFDGDIYATGSVGAFGAGSGNGGGGVIESVLGISAFGGSFDEFDYSNTFNAHAINSLHGRLNNLEAGSALSVETSGVGNAITSIAKIGTRLVATAALTFALAGHAHAKSDITDFPTTWDWASVVNKPSTYAPSAHTHSIVDLTNFPSTWAWSAITGKPTTLSGYGITDAAPSSHVGDISHLTLAQRNVLSMLSVDGSGNLAIGGNAYTTGSLGAFGVGAGEGGGAVGTVYGSAYLGGSFNDLNLTDTFNAYTINSIYTGLSGRISSLEGGSALTFNTTGSGNAVTSISKSGTVVTVYKNSTFSLSGHTHMVSEITDFPTTWAWASLTGVPSTFTPSAHTHTKASITDFPTVVSAFTNDSAYITGITKAMVEGVLTGGITSHTHTLSGITDFSDHSSNNTHLTAAQRNVLAVMSIIDSKLAITGDIYATGSVGAFGAGTGNGGGAVGTVLGSSYLGGSFNDTDLTTAFNAYTTNYLHTRISTLEGGSAINFYESGAGNAVTGFSKSGTSVTLLKNSTFSLSGHTHEYAPYSTRMYASDSPYRYGDSNPYFGYLTYNPTVGSWRFKVYPETPGAVQVDYADLSFGLSYSFNINIDLNQTIGNKFSAFSAYYPDGGVYNQPIAGGQHFRVLQFGNYSTTDGGAWSGQIATSFYSDRMFFRRQYVNDWNPWMEIWHSGNSNSYSVDWKTNSLIANGDITAYGRLQAYGALLHRSSIHVVNKNIDNWITWATRNSAGSEVVMDLSNIGSITANNELLVNGNDSRIRLQRSTGINYIDFNNGYDLKLRSISATDTNAIDALVLTPTGAATFASTITTPSSITIGSGLGDYQLNIDSNGAYSALSFKNNNVIRGQIFWDNTINQMIFGSATFNFRNAPLAPTAIFSNLTAGYIPYHTANGLVNSGIYTDGAKVGIGGVPTNKFHVVDSSPLSAVVIDNQSSVGYGLLVHTSNNTSASQYIFSARSGGIDRLYVRSDGNIGFGTSAPTGRVHVVGGNGLSLPATSGTTPTGVIARFQGDGTEGVLDFGNGGGGVSWIQSTHNSDLSATFKLLLNPNGGNVGIGKTDPSYTLDIYTNNEYQLGWQRISTNKWAIGTDSAGTYLSNRTNTILPIYITNAGNVGIGTTSPTVGKLQIDTDTGSSNAVTVGARGITSRTYGIGVNSSGNLSFYSNANSVEWMLYKPAEAIMSTSCSVLIGYPSDPQGSGNKLAVNGNTFTKGLTVSNGVQSVNITVDASGNLVFGGNVYSTGSLGAFGLGTGGGGTSYDRLDSWVGYDSDLAGWVLSAGLGFDLHTRMNTVESKPCYAITSGNISSWTSAYNWGNHASAGYLTAITKSQVESVLTGGITSHTHAKAGITDFPTSWAWSALSGVPSTFAPSAHNHTVAGITDFPSTWAWGSLSGVPSSFTPSAHTHTILTIAGYDIWNGSAPPSTYSVGLQISHVNTATGFPNFGTVITAVSENADAGGSFQIYGPASPTSGGTQLKVRFGNYSTGAFTAWKSVWDSESAGSTSYDWAAKDMTVNGVLLVGYSSNPASYKMAVSGTLFANDVITGTGLTVRNTSGQTVNITVDSNGRLAIAGSAYTTGSLGAYGQGSEVLDAAPSSATAQGTAGERRYASDGIYLCIAANTWRKVSLSTF